jgi:hypothetical protein
MTMLQHSDEARWTSEYQVMHFLKGKPLEIDIYLKAYKITTELLVLTFFNILL